MSESVSSQNADRCLVCGSQDWIFVREGTDLCRPSYGKTFCLRRCSACGLIAEIPSPDSAELDAAYSVSEDYACYRPAWAEQGWPIWKILRLWTTSRRLKSLRRHCGGKDLLEVGCGAGDFLVAAQGAGWNVRAVEYNKEMAGILREKFAVDVREGELAAGLWGAASFDVVALWNVLEHVPDPLSELTKVASYLRPGGTLLLNIPSRQAAEMGLTYGKYWALLDIPRHLHFLDRRTLAVLCEKAGLRLTEYRTPFVQSAWCYYMSCWNWAKEVKSRFRLLRFLFRAAMITPAMPLIAIRAARGKGVEAFAVVKKSEAGTAA